MHPDGPVGQLPDAACVCSFAHPCLHLHKGLKGLTDGSADAGVGVYSRCGYAKLRVDPAWVSILGGRQRVLMAKNAAMAPPSNGLPVSAAISSISPGLMRIFQSQTPDL